MVSAIPAEPAETQNTAEAAAADETWQDAAAAQVAAPDSPVDDQADRPAGSAAEATTTADPAPSAPPGGAAPVGSTSGLPAEEPESPGPVGSRPSTAASPDPSTAAVEPSSPAAAPSTVEPATPAGDGGPATGATPAAEPSAAEIFVTLETGTPTAEATTAGEPTAVDDTPKPAAEGEVRRPAAGAFDEPAADSGGQAEGDVTEEDEAAPRRAGRARTAVPDPVCAAAEELARAAAVEEAGDPAAVGEHLGVEAEGDRLVLHRFASLSPAYRGWVWAVVATRAPRVRKVTIDDVVLMPGDDALLAPLWVPWSQRLRPGDVGVGDLLPTAVDDPRLALRQADVEEFVDTDAFVELGLGRPRVLSQLGREEASARWYAGEPGPDAHVAKVAPATCLTCGFHVRLAGALGRLFGVCANELAPDDARVTSIDHGCGAHSEALIAPSAHPERVVFDEDPSDLEPTDVELVGAAANGATGQEPPQAHPAVGRPEPYGHA